MAGNESFDLPKLFNSQGYDCIVETIFGKLDSVTLAKCRLVCDAWRALIDSRRSLLVVQLRSMRQKKLEYPVAKTWYNLRGVIQPEIKCSVIGLFPAFKEAFLDLEKNANEPELQTVFKAMNDYIKDGIFPMKTLELSMNDEKRIAVSPVHQAIANGDHEFIRILMKRTRFDFQSPIQYDGLILTTFLALSVHNHAIIQVFLDYGTEKGINLNLANNQRRTAFHYACLHGSLDVVKLFLEKIPNVFLEINATDRDGSTPLHLACFGNQPETVQHLLQLSTDLRIDLNARDRVGLRPLHVAAKCGHVKVVKLLLEASLEVEIDVNALDLENKTPFSMACIYGHFEVAKLMIEKSRVYQIDLNLMDHDGESAFEHTVINTNFDIANLMVDNAKDLEISLISEDDILREKWLKVHTRMKSFGGLVFGRRPDLWIMNPLRMSSILTFVGFTFNLIWSLFFIAFLLSTIIQYTIIYGRLLVHSWLVVPKEIEDTEQLEEENIQCENQWYLQRYSQLIKEISVFARAIFLWGLNSTRNQLFDEFYMIYNELASFQSC